MKVIRYGWTWDGMSPVKDMRVEPDDDQMYVKLEDFLAVWEKLRYLEDADIRPYRTGGAMLAELQAPDPDYGAASNGANTPVQVRNNTLLANWQGTIAYRDPDENLVHLPADFAERAAESIAEYARLHSEVVNGPTGTFVSFGTSMRRILGLDRDSEGS